MCGRRVTHSDPLAAIHCCRARGNRSGPRGDRRVGLPSGTSRDPHTQHQHPNLEQGGGRSAGTPTRGYSGIATTGQPPWPQPLPKHTQLPGTPNTSPKSGFAPHPHFSVGTHHGSPSNPSTLPRSRSPIPVSPPRDHSRTSGHLAQLVPRGRSAALLLRAASQQRGRGRGQFPTAALVQHLVVQLLTAEPPRSRRRAHCGERDTVRSGPERDTAPPTPPPGTPASSPVPAASSAWISTARPSMTPGGSVPAAARVSRSRLRSAGTTRPPPAPPPVESSSGRRGGARRGRAGRPFLEKGFPRAPRGRLRRGSSQLRSPPLPRSWRFRAGGSPPRLV